MKVLNWLNKKRIILCPSCQKELYVHLFFTEKVLLKCLECNSYYSKMNLSKEITKSEISPELKEMLEKEADYSDYNGTPISQAFEPQWIKVVRRLIEK